MMIDSSSCWASARTRSNWFSLHMGWSSTDTGESSSSCIDPSRVQALSFHEDSPPTTSIFAGKTWGFVGRESVLEPETTRFVSGCCRKSRGVRALRNLGVTWNRKRTSDISGSEKGRERVSFRELENFRCGVQGRTVKSFEKRKSLRKRRVGPRCRLASGRCVCSRRNFGM